MNAAANKATTTNKTNKKKYERQETLRLDHGGRDENHRWNRVNGIGIKENKKKT